MHATLLMQAISLLTTLSVLGITIMIQRKNTLMNNQQKRLLQAISHLELTVEKLEEEIYRQGLQENQVSIDGPDSELSYNYAKKILESGGSLEDVLRDTSLTRGEAELLQALHDGQYRTTAAEAVE